MRISDWSSDVCSSDLSCSSGFCVASTWKGVGSTCDWPDTVTRRSCIACSRADWVRGLARLISSAIRSWQNTGPGMRSEEHTSELQSLMRISYAVFCLKKKKTHTTKKANENTWKTETN